MLWAATEGGLAKLENGAWHTYRPGRELPSEIVTQLLETTGRDGVRTLWVATSKGIARLRDGVWDVLDRADGGFVLLIGAGGAAAGVLGPLLEARPAQLHMVNRTADKAAALLRRHTALAAQCGVSLSCGGLHQAGQAYDVVLNASASSLGGVAAPVCERVLRSGTLALDLMYGAAAQPFMAWAAAHGAVPRDGLGMLVEQAAEAFAIWRGVRPPSAQVLEELRRAPH